MVPKRTSRAARRSPPSKRLASLARRRATIEFVDPIRQDDVEWAKQTPPAEKLSAALKMMRFGIRLKRSALVASHPGAEEAEVDAMLQAWLDTDG